MTSKVDESYLPDVNVWIALVSDRHEHHALAANWFYSNSGLVLFCRVTQMAFLRLLTNRRVMGDEVLTPRSALQVYGELLDDERIGFRNGACDLGTCLGFSDERRGCQRK